MTALTFGRFALDVHRRILLRDGAPVPATPKTLDLLEALIKQAGEIVTKDEIVREVWQGESVSDATIAQHVSMLRAVLDDEYRGNKYIVTVPRRGYRFVGTDTASVRAATTENDEAFRAYCHGQYLLQERTAEGLDEAIRWFERATQVDPSFAAGYQGLAASTAMSGIWMHRAPEQVFCQARDAAMRALELGDDPGPRTILGEIACFFERNWDEAQAEHRRAIALRPDAAQTRHSLAWVYVCTGKLDEALAEITRAQTLDPSSLTIAANRATILSWSERHSDALQQLGDVLQLSPQFSLGRYMHAVSLACAGDYGTALNELLFVNGFRDHTQALEAECQARLGREEIARQTLGE
ncbi:MAG TPA: winged helix-turn-helix domain-containing protein, partial [Candidatus Cybelea sp.]